MAVILDGKKYSQQILEQIKQKRLSNPTDKKFAIITVGDDKASEVYCNMKKKRATDLGIVASIYKYSEDQVTQNELKELINSLSTDSNIAGIMIQHPLPKKFNERELFDLIPEQKDVDGLSYKSLGRIQTGNLLFVPATALGIIDLLKYYNIDLVGKRVLVIGRSQIVGLPLANILIKESATVTLAHSRTSELSDMIKDFDIVIAAIGKPEYLKAKWFREGQIIVDAGYNEGNVGDIDHNAYLKSSYYTPVPGGVGPMTVASLMKQLDRAVDIIEGK